MNIRKHVVRNPATLNQMIRRRFLLTGGSGIDSTTTAGGFPAGFAAALGAGGAAAAAGGAAMVKLSSFRLLSTPKTLRLTKRFPGWRRAHTSTPGELENYTVPRDTGIAVSVKTDLILITRSASVPNANNNYKLVRQNAFYTTFAIVFARG